MFTAPLLCEHAAHAQYTYTVHIHIGARRVRLMHFMYEIGLLTRAHSWVLIIAFFSASKLLQNVKKLL